MEQEHKQQEEEDAGTENEGRTGEKEEKEAGKENVFFDILDVAGEALALQEEKHLPFLQLKKVLHKAKKKKGKRKTEKVSLAPSGLKPTPYPLDLRGWKFGPGGDLWAVIQLQSSVHRERRHFSSSSV